MTLPKGQDVIAHHGCGAMVELVDAWLANPEGPLPHDLEQAALELFTDDHPMGLWAEANMRAERHKARRQVARMYLRFSKMQRWTLGNMHDNLEAGFGRVVFGDRGPSTGELKQLRDYVAACLSDLFSIFSGDERMKQTVRSAGETVTIN